MPVSKIISDSRIKNYPFFPPNIPSLPYLCRPFTASGCGDPQVRNETRSVLPGHISKNPA
ncbi:MAG: hypothetical protein BGO52_01810 [Sphingobacteriales bacterium 44-61]|nr:MAG: hypothetical protein BGO52_01810 [Sphingobacteriales bacterium 44-61]